MKEKMNSKEIEKYFKERLNNNKQNLDKINDLSTFDYFNDPEIEGYPWWGEWKEKLAELDQENLILGENYQKTKLEEDYEKYSESDKQLQDLKIRIDEDVTKYKESYKEKLVENLSEDIKDFREAVEYNISLIDKELKRLTDRRDLLLKEKEALRASYKGEDYDAFFYEKINKLFGKINQLEDEKKALINLERDLDIEEFEKVLKENTPEPVKPEPIGPDPVKPDPVNPDPVNPDPVNPDPVKPDPVNPDPVNPEPIEEDKDKYSNSYNKSMDEYEMLLEAYKEDLEKLYELQEKYENGNIEYSEYEKHADYMVGRYSVVKKEYENILERYNKEKKSENKFAGISNEDLQKQLEASKEKLALSGDRLKELKGYDEQYAYERATYSKIVEEIDEMNKEIAAREKNPYRAASKEQLEVDKQELKKQLEASGKRLKELKGYDEQYAYERAVYSELVEKLNQVEAELKVRVRVPEKPEQPMMILEKEGLGEGSSKNLPVRSFWEIYNDTCTEHASNFAVKMHNFAHMKILAPKNENTLRKVLAYPFAFVKIPLKIASKIPNKIMGTDKKFNAMLKNIENLSPVEFDVLVSSSDKIKELYGEGIKSELDIDYLGPQSMKQYKINELYLNAVAKRYCGEKDKEINQCNQRTLEIEKRIEALDNIKENKALTPEESKEFDELIKEKQKLRGDGENIVSEKNKFIDGIKKKSSAYRNIRGWFLGTFNPDNREQNEKMAEMAKARREAEEAGKNSEASAITYEMQEYAKEQTKIKGIGNNRIDRGPFSIEKPVEELNRGEQNTGRQILACIAITTSLVDLAKQISTIKEMKQAINEHNEQLEAVNDANRNILISENIDLSQLPMSKEAQAAFARQLVEDGFNRGERGNLAEGGWDVGNLTYKALDSVSHSEAAQVKQVVEDFIANGNSQQAISAAQEYFYKVVDTSNQQLQQFLTTAYRNMYNHDAMNWYAIDDVQTVVDFLQGTVSFNKVVSGVMAKTIQDLQISPNPLATIMGGANFLYQAGKIKIEDKFKNSLKVKIKDTKKEKVDKELDEELEEELDEEIYEDFVEVSDDEEYIDINEGRD